MVATVFEEPVLRRYQAPVFSLSFCFHVLTIVGMLVIPFYAVFASRNFWLKTNTLWDQPEIKFTYDLVLILQGEGQDGQPTSWVWASDVNVRELYDDAIRSPMVKAWSEDSNDDNKVDVWRVTLQMPMEAQEKVYQAQAMLWFDYRLTGAAALNMDSMVFLQHSSPMPGTGLIVEGEARLRQRKALSIRRENAHPDLKRPTSTQPLSMYENSMQYQLGSFARRNFTMELANKYELWTTGVLADSFAIPSGSFYLNFTMRVPTDEILYTPDVPEVLKVAWIQYLSFFLLFYGLFSLLRSFVYTGQVLETSVFLQGKTHFSRQKQHRF